jgi:hypothetical protein
MSQEIFPLHSKIPVHSNVRWLSLTLFYFIFREKFKGEVIMTFKICSGGTPNNAPSKTGNPSGPGRGNNPPSK